MAEQGFPIVELGAAIRERRQAIGLSQGRLAQLASVNLRTIQRWEDGETMKARDKLDQVAAGLDCSEQELVARAYEIAGLEPPSTSQPTGDERLIEMIQELRGGQMDLLGRISHLEELLGNAQKSQRRPGSPDSKDQTG
jgi:transcriptional regulator with XRE-family HTH domain